MARHVRTSRRNPQPQEDRSGAWLTTYADAVTLLMAFFVMLYAMSEVDVLKFTAFLQGLSVPFGNDAGEGLLPATDGLQPEDTPRPPMDPDDRPVSIARGDGRDAADLDDPADPDDPTDLDDPTDRDAPTTERGVPGFANFDVPPELLAALEDLDVQAGTIEALQRLEAAYDQLDLVAATLDDVLVERSLDDFVEQRREERGLVVSIASDDVLFPLGRTDISDIGREVIETVAVTLGEFPNPLLIEGHTDDLPLDRGGYTNWNLSTDRAVAVLQLMLDEHGLPPDRVGAVGYGEHHPLVESDGAGGSSRNRRVDIVVLIEETVR